MLKKLQVLLFICIAQTTFSQQNQLTINDLLGTWSIGRDLKEPLKTYLVKSDYNRSQLIYGVKFYIKKHSKKKALKSIDRDISKRKCSKDKGNMFVQRFVKYNRWEYDEKSGTIEFFYSGYDKSSLKCKIEILSPERILLIEIE